MQSRKIRTVKASYSFTQPMIYGLVGLVLLWLIVAQFAPATQAAPPQPNLGLILMVAVGIERLMEGLWTFVDRTKNSFWPLSLTRYIDEFSRELTDFVNPTVTEIDQALSQADNLLDQAPEKTQQLKAMLSDLKTQLVSMKNLTDNIQVVEAARASVVDTLTQLEAQYPTMDAVVSKTQLVVNNLDEYITTLKGNPGRKLVSLFFGAYIGLGIAWALNLDIFLSAAGAAAPVSQILGGWRVAFTGVLLGLGSGPLHEVIRAIQAFKNAQKTLEA